MFEKKPLITARSPLLTVISKRRPALRQLRPAVALTLAASLLAAPILTGCGGSKEQPGVVGTVKGFLGGAVADEPRAALEARDILSAGGSAADAAVALYFTLAVTLPSTATLGGGGVCLVYDAKLARAEMLDFVARPPAGGGAIAVPATARGMFLLQSKYGKLRWEQLVSRAENLARFGHPVSRALAADLLAAAPILQGDPGLREIFLKADGAPYREGELLVQREVSTLLSAIRSRGAGELYNGPLATRFAEASRARGAAITIEDMRAAGVAWRPAIFARHEDNVVVVPSPPAAAGLVEAQLWAMAAPRWRRAPAEERPHLFAQASLRAWVDRSRWLGPDLSITAASPLELVSERYLASLMGSYRPDQRTPASVVRPRSEPVIDDAAATSFVTVDRDGNGVACTVSPHGLFGAGRVAPGTGVVLANAADGMQRGPQWFGPMMVISGAAESFLSTRGMTGGSQLVFVGAASGGAGATSALASVVLRTVIERRSLEEALDAQRIHFEGAPADTVFVEAGVQSRPPGLAERGYQILPVPVIGRVNAMYCPDGLRDGPSKCLFRPDRRGFGMSAGGL